jgi:hypothetical protein
VNELVLRESPWRLVLACAISVAFCVASIALAVAEGSHAETTVGPFALRPLVVIGSLGLLLFGTMLVVFAARLSRCREPWVTAGAQGLFYREIGWLSWEEVLALQLSDEFLRVSVRNWPDVLARRSLPFRVMHALEEWRRTEPASSGLLSIPLAGVEKPASEWMGHLKAIAPVPLEWKPR